MQSSDVEMWKAIEGIPHYEVSSIGRVRSLERVVRSGKPTGFRTVKPGVMKTFVSRKTGYMQIAIYTRRYSVHRLVAKAFLGAPPTPKHVVNHLNGKPADNRVENLEWTTASGNMKHAYEVLGAIPSSLGKFSADHPASKSVVSRCMKTGTVRAWGNGMDAVREGFDSSSISRCCHGIYRFHRGHEWRFGSEWPSTNEGENP